MMFACENTIVNFCKLLYDTLLVFVGMMLLQQSLILSQILIFFSVYLYHEVSQLFRKETRDFCVLQTEQQEANKYIVSLRSVGWPGCEENENITRGKVILMGER